MGSADCGGSIFFAGNGFKDVYNNGPNGCPIPGFCTPESLNPAKPQYSLFSQAKFIF